MFRSTNGGEASRPRSRRRVAALTASVLLAALAAGPVEAYFTKEKILFRDGQILVVQQDVGNQAFHYQWVEGDARRHADDPLALYYRIDLVDLPSGVSASEVEAAIEAAVATFEEQTCSGAFDLIRVDTDPGADLGSVEGLFHGDPYGPFGGEDAPVADITFAGWLPAEFMTAAGVPGSFGVALPLAFEAGGSLAWGTELWEDREFTDVNRDRKADLFATEIYFNRDWTYVIDDPDRANTLFAIDVQTIATHELGHAIGMGHFGRSILVLDDNGQFVDILVNPNSLNLMNTNSYYQKRDLSGADVASFCGLYANWGKVRAGS